MRLLLSILSLSALASAAAAQSFNIDVGSNLGALYPLPSSTYAAGAAQPGTWNDVHSPYNATLVKLDGSASTVTTSSSTSASFNQFPATLSGDDQAFMDDIQDLPSIGGPWTWTFSGLQDGNYVLYTYAWDPANNGRQTSVNVPTSSDPAQIVGGIWTGAQALGVTYALHHVALSGGTFQVQVDGQGGHDGSINGFQLVFGGGSATNYCFGDGSGTACPCANNSTAGNGEGCLSSLGIGGKIGASGVASLAGDSILLAGSQMPNSSALYFQGTTQLSGGNGVTFGDGLRCVGGSIVRLKTVTNSGGASQYPGGGDPSVSVKGAITSPGTRTYQAWYRNAAAFCTASTFNLTNGVSIVWGP